MDTLSEMEKIEVDNKDKPIEDIIIEKVHIFVDPYQEADEMLAKERAEELQKQQQAKIEAVKRKNISQPLKVFREGVGKYLNTSAVGQSSTSSQAESSDEPALKRKKIEKTYRFGNFKDW